MGYKIERTSAFEGDFEDAVEYLFLELKSPQAAKNLIREMRDRSKILESNPYVNAVSQKPLLCVKGVRELLVKKYVALYVVNGDAVFLLRFFHQKQLYERFFR